MSTAPTSPILQQIRRMVEDEQTKQRSDLDLLATFAQQRDDMAFHALVRRHGPMVLHVCRCVVANEADAEDAFQATFLVLARKAHSIRKACSLGSWLHGVAYRTALDARRKLARRCKHELRAPPRDASTDMSWSDVQRVLHEELSQLAERFRSPVVLCYLEDRTQDEAAKLLGIPKGTLKMRLEHGRALLRTRLIRRGLGQSALLVAAVWPVANAAASVPMSVIVSTVKAASLFAAGQTAAAGIIAPSAAALTEGMLKAMMMSKLKAVVAVVLVLGLVVTGATVLTGRTAVAQPAAEEHKPLAFDPPVPKAKPAAADLPSRAADPDLKPLVLVGHEDWITSVAFSPEGKRVTSSSRDRTVRLWDATTGQEMLTLKKQKGEVKDGHEEYVQAVAFSPDGKFLASAGSDNAIYLWSTTSGRALACLSRSSSPVMSVTYSPDGKRLASAAADSVKVWDANPEMHTGGYILSLPVKDALSVAFSPNGKLLASAGRDKTIRVWNPTTAEELLTMASADQVVSVAFSPDGKRLASSGGDGVRVWDASTGKLLLKLEESHAAGSVAFSPDGDVLAAPVGSKLVRLWDASTGKQALTLDGHGNSVLAVSFSPEGKRLATAGVDRTVRIWTLPPRNAGLTAGGKVLVHADGRKVSEIDGVWQLTRLINAGQADDSYPKKNHRATLKEQTWEVTRGGEGVIARLTFTLDVKENPKQLVLNGNGMKVLCIYEIRGDELKVAMLNDKDHFSTSRPADFNETKETTVKVYQRVKDAREKDEGPSGGRERSNGKHDFTNLQRLATALENFNYPENTATTITVWCQGGGKGNSVQVTDAKALDVAAACHMIVDGHHDKKGLDLENVAIVSADGSLVRFVNIKEKFAANRPFGFNVNRGDLVIVLQLRKD